MERGLLTRPATCALPLPAALGGRGGGGSAQPQSLPAEVAFSAEAALGEQIFHDTSLSASGRQSCASCHLPHNLELQRNADPAYFDRGLCRSADLSGRPDLCGAFQVPSLRNVVLRQAYIRNGRFKTLKDALTFYIQRDTNPESPIRSPSMARRSSSTTCPPRTARSQRDRGSLKPQPPRRAGIERRGNGRLDRLPSHPERRLYALSECGKPNRPLCPFMPSTQTETA